MSILLACAYTIWIFSLFYRSLTSSNLRIDLMIIASHCLWHSLMVLLHPFLRNQLLFNMMTALFIFHLPLLILIIMGMLPFFLSHSHLHSATIFISYIHIKGLLRRHLQPSCHVHTELILLLHCPLESTSSPSFP